MPQTSTDPVARRPEESYHYNIVRRAIEEIDAAGSALSLEDLAGRMGLSPAHFQRIFSAWAGVSPARYQQYLTLAHAKELLRNHHSTLDTALETGLSGTGRLHDLFLRWEAMSPGEAAKGGAGLSIGWAELDTPFGPALAMATDRGLCGLAFTAEMGREAAWTDLTQRWPNADFRHDSGHVLPLARPAFDRHGETRLHLAGGPFQIKVWEALMAIPQGQVATYSDIARATGNPTAQRAVGTAVGRNPVAFLIPCHRVLRKDGGLGGYHWGTPVKRAILAWESLREEA